MGLAEWAIALARLQHPDLYDIHVDSVEWEGAEMKVEVSGKLPVDLIVIDLKLVPFEQGPFDPEAWRRCQVDEQLTCTECGGKIDPDAFASVMSDLAHHADTDEPYHWACLQECYERERLADGED